MGRLIWGALSAALAVTCAGGAQATVVYSTSGVFCNFSSCLAPIVIGPNEDSFNFPAFRNGEPKVGPGNYAYELIIDPARVTQISVAISPWDIWNEWFNGQPIGGDETRAPQPATTFQATATGYVGTFSVKDNTDVTSPATMFGEDGFLRRQDVYATGITIYANVSGSQVPYAFNLSRIDAVPEPEVWTLMLGGFFGLGAMLRGQRRVTA
jgi:hypothetical protein